MNIRQNKRRREINHLEETEDEYESSEHRVTPIFKSQKIKDQRISINYNLNKYSTVNDFINKSKKIKEEDRMNIINTQTDITCSNITNNIIRSISNVIEEQLIDNLNYTNNISTFDYDNLKNIFIDYLDNIKDIQNEYSDFIQKNSQDYVKALTNEYNSILSQYKNENEMNLNKMNKDNEEKLKNVVSSLEILLLNENMTNNKNKEMVSLLSRVKLNINNELKDLDLIKRNIIELKLNKSFENSYNKSNDSKDYDNKEFTNEMNKFKSKINEYLNNLNIHYENKIKIEENKNRISIINDNDFAIIANHIKSNIQYKTKKKIAVIKKTKRVNPIKHNNMNLNEKILSNFTKHENQISKLLYKSKSQSYIAINTKDNTEAYRTTKDMFIEKVRTEKHRANSSNKKIILNQLKNKGKYFKKAFECISNA